MVEEAAAAAAWPGLVLLHHHQTFHSASAGQRMGVKREPFNSSSNTQAQKDFLCNMQMCRGIVGLL